MILAESPSLFLTARYGIDTLIGQSLTKYVDSFVQDILDDRSPLTTINSQPLNPFPPFPSPQNMYSCNVPKDVQRMSGEGIKATWYLKGRKAV